MFRYAKITDYELPTPRATKEHQRLFMSDTLPNYANSNSRVLEVGADRRIEILQNLEASERWIADPYEGTDGGQQTGLPDFGKDITIARCRIGDDSSILPSGIFDLIYSISVIEHIGQAASGFDCRYTPSPPDGQEAPRRSFCSECYRLLRPGGVTIHTIDHGVRNVTFDGNFRDAGFEPLLDEPRLSHEEMLNDPQALRQEFQWGTKNDPVAMPEEVYSLNTVLMLGYRKPLSGC